MLFLAIIFLLCIQCIAEKDASTKHKGPPHIIFIMADDLGWNDVGFHGSNEIPTPNIDALAYSGIILNKYYVLHVCTPSRSALMTGRLPIHTGMQHRVLFGMDARGLPLKEKLLPEYLKELGYSTHIVGKWHLGFYKKEYTPTHRGFESHFGYWTGHQDYYDHTAEEPTNFDHHRSSKRLQTWGVDMRENMDVSWSDHGHYSTHAFTARAEKIIRRHNSSKPLFLYVAHAAVHSGNKYNPLPAPDRTIDSLHHVKNYYRRRFAAMTKELDESVGSIIEALHNSNMLRHSVIVFSTDNGGPAVGYNYNHASNWPLRGMKNTLWEGGVRGVGAMWSPHLTSHGRVSNQMMHISDWLPTLYAAAGGHHEDLRKNIDGYNLWKALTEDTPSERKEVLVNIDDQYRTSALVMGKWKIVKGDSPERDGWYGPSGRDPTYRYNIGHVIGSKAGRAFAQIQSPLTTHIIKKIRQEATVTCDADLLSMESRFSNCHPRHETCLFNINEDPCEKDNVAEKYPDILDKLEERLRHWNSTAVPPGRVHKDPHGDPMYWGYVWTNFGDAK